MCLSNAVKVKLEEDKTVYKVLFKRLYGELVSPYFGNFSWKLGKRYYCHGKPEIENYSTVNGNCFHTCCIEHVGLIKERLSCYYGKSHLGIYECTIPKNSKYVYADGHGNFASSSLIINREMERFEELTVNKK